MCERLPQNYVPIHYDFFLHITKDNYPFNASVKITFKKNQDSDKVYLHTSPNISINKITQNDINLEYTIDKSKLIITRSTEPDQDIISYPISIEYLLTPNLEEDYGKKPHGFYTYQNSYLTKFECGYARQMLPCFDDPNIRATYTVRIIIPEDLTGISNMPLEKENFLNNEKEKELTFLETPPMCSYLLCICVGNFGFIESETKFGTKVKFYCEKGKEEALHEYLRVSVFSLEWLEEKLKTKYELPHLQLITYKGCKIGMENYGLITLCDYTNGTEFLRHSKVVMHEIAHQWFGDLVSIKWWDSVWLNEGFAQFFQFLILNDCDPDFNGKGVQHFVNGNGFRCLRFFSKDKVVPLASEIDFSKRVLKACIYIKGAFILKMFRDIVGEESFLNVCSNYCNEFKNKSAEANDFIEIANKTLNNDYSEFFNVWLRSIGYPALFVEPIVSQEKYVGVNVVQKSFNGSVFQFKLQVAFEKDGKIDKKEFFVKNEVTKIDVEFDWIVVNDNLCSLCVVIYTSDLLNRLLIAANENKLSKSNLSLISRSPAVVSPQFSVDPEVSSLASQFEKLIQ